MMRILCICLLLFMSVTGYSQRVYFIYLQTETEQPFFVRMNDKTTSSTNAGYLILSRLRDSTYTFRLGFPQNKFPEQQFTVDIKGTDRGFIVKNLGEKGWGLFDLQSLAMIMSSVAAKKPAEASNAQVSAFTDILSKAANDPTLRDKPVMVKADDKPVQVMNAVVNEEVKARDDKPVETVLVPEKKEEMRKDTLISKPSIVKEELKRDTMSMAVTKQSEIAKDTMMAVAQSPEAQNKLPVNESAVVKKEVPMEEVKEKADSVGDQGANKMAVAVESEPKNEQKNEPKKETPKETVKEELMVKSEVKSPPIGSLPIEAGLSKEKIHDEPKKEVEKPVVEKKNSEPAYKRSTVVKRSESSTSEGFGLTFVDSYPEGKKDTIKILIPVSKEAELTDIRAMAKDSPAIGSRVVKQVPLKTCSSVATESDFLKLRKRMAAMSKDEAMINESKKAFKGKCYMTEQVKNLGGLFLTEAGKFQFLEVAYPFVVDADKFVGLQSEFKDPYFVHRFKNLVN